MADNVAITAGSGTSVATDDVSGVHFQRVKLVDGAADSSAAIGGDATHGLDVDVTRLPRGSKTLSNATPTDSAASQVIAANANRLSVIIYNASGGTVYLGEDNTVSATTGIPLVDGTAITDQSSTDAWYARCASGVAGDLRIIEVE